MQQLLLTLFLWSPTLLYAQASDPLQESADLWDEFLKKYFDPDSGRVDYEAIEKTGRESLKSIIERFSTIKFATLNDKQKIAAYINLYNAGMVSNLLRHCDEKKITVTSPAFLSLKINEISVPGGNIWNGDYRFLVGGQKLSLDDLEHGLIRGKKTAEFPTLAVKDLDPRIHVAANCAALSCPRVREKAYRENNLDAMLAENLKATVNSPLQLKKLSESKMQLNQIFYWYYEDFDSFARKKLSLKGAGDYLAQFVADHPDSAWVKKHLVENFSDRNKIALKLSSAFDFQYEWKINDKRNHL